MTLQLASSVVFHSHSVFLMKLVSALLAVYSAKHSCIHVWGIKSQPIL